MPVSDPEANRSTVPPTSGEWWVLDNGSDEELMVVARRTDPFRDVAHLRREPDQDFAEVEANAQLIVASKNLLAAAKAMIAYESMSMADIRQVGGAAAAKRVGETARRQLRAAIELAEHEAHP